VDIEEVMTLATNLQLDDRLIERAVKLGKHKTKRAAVTQALKDYVEHLEQQKLLALFGNVDYDLEYDYKKQRKKA
jgi:Arc/MetJ family transcription regulator